MPKHELNDFQEAVLECLLDAQRERVGVITRNELLQRMQDTPGYDDCHHQRLGPCVKTLQRRGLLAEDRAGHFRITDAGDVALGHAMAGAAPGDADSSVEEPFTVTEVDDEPEPEPAPDPVTRIDPETRRVILPATKDEIDAANIAASRPGDYVDPGYHAGHGECLGGLHYSHEAETLHEGSALDRVEQQDDHLKKPRYQDRHGDDWIDEFFRIATVDEVRGAMRFTIGKYLRRMGRKDRREVELRKIEDYARRWREYEQSLEGLD